MTINEFLNELDWSKFRVYGASEDSRPMIRDEQNRCPICAFAGLGGEHNWGAPHIGIHHGLSEDDTITIIEAADCSIAELEDRNIPRQAELRREMLSRMGVTE